jgi:DNA-binding CsgD family transcriptional regulator
MSYGLKQTANTESFDLTRLELIGLTLVASGLGVAQIASRLSASEADILQTLQAAERKLGASNRLHAITIAIQQGLIGIEVKG